MTVVLFLIILAILIFVHELGHFTAAKLFGIRVDEFAIGFPPKVFSWTRGETKYALNLIPFGGYVKIFGENPDEESISGPDSGRALVNAPKWKRVIILLSGISMNILFAWILISISLNIGFLTGIDDQYKDKAENVSVIVLSVLKSSPSDLAGIKEGDKILSIEENKKVQEHLTVLEIQNLIAESTGALKITYERNSATGTASVIAKKGVVEGKKAIGISMASVGTLKFSFFRSFYEGAKFTYFETKNITKGIYTFVVGLFMGQTGSLSEITGPVGIANMVGEARNIGFSYLLSFIATISINLAVLNAVPFPALDGGRVFFILIETIIRRKIKPTVANIINGIGFAVLIALMFFITYKDILRLVK